MDSLQDLVLSGVEDLPDSKSLGRGAFGRVYPVKYRGMICAAKQIRSSLLEGMEMRKIVESFAKECRQCSTLRHPNIVQFLGVYNRSETSSQGSIQLPVMVMEMMTDSLTSLMRKHEFEISFIPLHIKFSIVNDVSLGLLYLHNHAPAIVHRDLSSNNILLTAHHVAKISDLGVAKILQTNTMSNRTSLSRAGTRDFMPPESLIRSPTYGPPTDVFSLAGIILHTFNQEWPTTYDKIKIDQKNFKKTVLSEVQRRQQHLDKMTKGSEVLKPLVISCLAEDPKMRPTMVTIIERIQKFGDAHNKSPQSLINLHLEIDQLNKQLSVAEKSLKDLKDKKANIRKEAPPLVPALTSSKYTIKWTHLANSPAPICDAYATVQDKKIYVAGMQSPLDDAYDQVYVYDLNTDQWDSLPPSGHFFGIPCIIGSKLSVIGGFLSATRKKTNTVSTFDEHSRTWTLFYPNLISVRSKPGVARYQEYVIVMGGSTGDATRVIQDDIEILNWIENSHWKKTAIKLPVPMWNFTPTMVDDYLVIVGYHSANMQCSTNAYKILVTDITKSCDQQPSISDVTKQQNDEQQSIEKWVMITEATHWATSLITGISKIVVIGGENETGKTTDDVNMYDSSSKSWKKIAFLSPARSYTTAVAISDNAIVVIGGCTKGENVTNATSTSLNMVHLGQAVQIH